MLEKLLGLSRNVEFKIESEAWKFELLRPDGKLKRAQTVSRLLGGVNIESVTADDYSRAFKIGTLAIAYVDGPEKFVEDYKKDFGAVDDEYLSMLFDKYAAAEAKFDEAKKKFRPAQGSEKS